MSVIGRKTRHQITLGVADLDYEFSFGSFEKSTLKLIFGYVQNHHSYLDSATPSMEYAVISY
jgi:hypothetical protein